MLKGFWSSRRSLRAQLALFAISILTPALLALGVLLLVNVNEGREARGQEFIATARAVSAAIDQELVRGLATGAAVAASEALERGDWATARDRAVRVASGPDEWLALTDEQGRQLFNTNPEARQGDIWTVTPENIRLAREMGTARVSDLVEGSATGRKLVAVDTPVQHANQVLNLAYLIDPARFVAVVAERPTPTGAMVTVLDRQHRVVARSRQQERFLGVLATPDVRAAVGRQSEGILASRSLEGQPTVVAYTHSPLTGWSTLVVMPRSVFAAPLYRSLAVLGLVSIGVLAVGAAAAFFYSRTIARELASLEQDAQAVGRGEVVTPRPGRISNFEHVQATLAEASRELSVQADRQRLMINELNHRVKNALATVQSLAVQTFRGADPETARAKFDTRLTALAAGHDLITQKNWEQVELADIVARCGAQPDQITSEGPSVTLQPQAALAMCMCLHELTTNSLKYGALSTSAGQIRIDWTVCPDVQSIEFVWREIGGPPVAPPTEGGFGTRLIDRLARHELAGAAERQFPPEGLVCTIRMGLTAASRWRNDFNG